jgi:hypothetical protein
MGSPFQLALVVGGDPERRSQTRSALGWHATGPLVFCASWRTAAALALWQRCAASIAAELSIPHFLLAFLLRSVLQGHQWMIECRRGQFLLSKEVGFGK